MTALYLITSKLGEADSNQRLIGAPALLLSEPPPIQVITDPRGWNQVEAYVIDPAKVINRDWLTSAFNQAMPFYLKTEVVTLTSYDLPEPERQRRPEIVEFYPEPPAPAVALAAAMPRGKRQRREPYCLACGKPLEGRRDKKYCDPVCRKAGHRGDGTAHVHQLAKDDHERDGLRSKTVKPHSKPMSRLKRGN